MSNHPPNKDKTTPKMTRKQMCDKNKQKKGDSDLFFLICLFGLSPLCDNALLYI